MPRRRSSSSSSSSGSSSGSDDEGQEYLPHHAYETKNSKQTESPSQRTYTQQPQKLSTFESGTSKWGVVGSASKEEEPKKKVVAPKKQPAVAKQTAAEKKPVVAPKSKEQANKVKTAAKSSNSNVSKPVPFAVRSTTSVAPKASPAKKAAPLSKVTLGEF